MGDVRGLSDAIARRWCTTAIFPMPSTSRSSRVFPSRPRASGSSALLVVLRLFCTLALAAMLAYEAHDTAKSHRATADRALHNYASVAAWEFVAGVGDALQSALGPAFSPVRARAMSPYELLP